MYLLVHQLVDRLVDRAHSLSSILGEGEEKLGDIVDVLSGAGNDLLQVLRIVLQSIVIQLVLECDRAQFGHAGGDWHWGGTLVNFHRQVHDLFTIEEDCLVRVIRWHLRGTNLRQNCRTRNSHELFLVVQCQNPRTNVLDTRVDHIQSILSRINVRDDPIVHINEGLFCSLDAQEHSVEEFRLVHLVRR